MRVFLRRPDSPRRGSRLGSDRRARAAEERILSIAQVAFEALQEHKGDTRSSQAGIGSCLLCRSTAEPPRR